MKHVNLMGRTREELLIVADRACSALASIASNLTREEGDDEATEEEFGTTVSDVIEMAHDNMIVQARAVLDSLIKELGDSK